MNTRRIPSLLLALVALVALVTSRPSAPEAQTRRFPVYASSVTTLTSTGRSLAVASDVDTARAVLGARVVDPLAGSGWTITPSGAGASATWSTSPARLTATVTSGSGGVLVAAEHSTLIPGIEEYDLIVRLDVVSGDAASGTSKQVVLRCGQSASSYLTTTMRSDGAMEVGWYYSGGGGTLLSMTPVTGIDSGVRTGGDLHLRVARRLGRIVVMYGVGSTLASIVWNTVYNSPETVSENALLASQGTWVSVILYAPSSQTGDYVLDATAIRAVSQRSGAL